MNNMIQRVLISRVLVPTAILSFTSLTLNVNAETYQRSEGVYGTVGAGMYDPVDPKDRQWTDSDGRTRNLDHSYHGQLGLGYRLGSRWATELNWLRTPYGAKEERPDISQGRIDALFYPAQFGNAAPYLKAGLGHEIVKIYNNPEDQGTMWTAGVGMDYLLSNNLFLRADASFAKSWEEKYEHMVYTLGLGYAFGGDSQSYETVSNNDVDDSVQAEKNKQGNRLAELKEQKAAEQQKLAELAAQKEAERKASEAALAEKINNLPATAAAPIILDADGDGVIDSMDTCSSTDAKLKVDANGCPVFEGTLPGIQFENNSSVLTAESRKVITSIAQSFKQYPNLQVEVQAYTDSVGKDSYNQWLSEKRAATVKKALIEDGVDAAALTSIGLGELHPIADNSTRAGRAKNRRVEMVVTK